MRKTETFTSKLKCILTREEVEERSARMADVERDMRALEAQKKQINSDLKSQKDALDAELGRLGFQVREHCEFRDVECRLDYDGDEVLTIRIDTEELVTRRKALPEELQEELPIDDGPRPERPLRRKSER